MLRPAIPARGDTVTLTPAQDNSLYQDAAGALSNGSGIYLFVGRTAQLESISRRRALLAFDVAGPIPAGSTITGVTLTLNLSFATPGDQTLELRAVSADWGEGASDAPGEEGMGGPSAPGDATWIHRFYDTTPWTAAGGDFSTTVSSSAIVGGAAGFYTWPSTARLVADVQAWLDDPASSFGWIIIENETTDTTAKRFDSRDHPTAANRPMLTIDFAPPDCNINGVPDADDIAAGTSDDCDANGVPDECQPDTDGDGTVNACGGCPADPAKTMPGVCGCGTPDNDSDSDAAADCVDGCPTDPAKTSPGQCGCGNNDLDADGDGAADCIDGCPQDSAKTAPGACGCGQPETDRDHDGSADCIDECDDAPSKSTPGLCGCGLPDADNNGDGVADCLQPAPPQEDGPNGSPGAPTIPIPTSCGTCGAVGTTPALLAAALPTPTTRRRQRRC